MSYLDFSRIYFRGTFYASAATLNNTPTNYINNATEISMENDWGWNPNGDNQLYFRGGQVCGVVDEQGTLLESGSSNDPLLTAEINTQGPYSRMSQYPGVPTSSPKLVDFDPDQQFRTGLYGLWLGLVIPGETIGQDAGFYAPVIPCNLRDLGLRANPPIEAFKTWNAGGVFLARIEASALNWLSGTVNSPLLDHFRETYANGISLKMVFDLYRNENPNGDVLHDYQRYGRLLGVLGPADDEDFQQAVTCRRLFTNPMCPQVDPDPQGGGEVEPIPWLPGYASTQDHPTNEGEQVLTLDLSGSIPYQSSTDDYGKLADAAHLEYGYFKEDNWVPFKNQPVQLVDHEVRFEQEWKYFYYLKNNGVFDIWLTKEESDAIRDRPIGVKSLKKENAFSFPLRESNDGIYIETDQPGVRVQQGDEAHSLVMVSQFGEPVRNQPVPLELKAYKVKWVEAQGPKGPVWEWHLDEDSDIEVQLSDTDGKGAATLTMTPKAQVMELSAARHWLDSRINYVLIQNRFEYCESNLHHAMSGPSPSVPMTGLEFATALVWRDFQAPENPTWEDVGPILGRMSRLYPGMSSKMDLSDEALMVKHASIVLPFLEESALDPLYMPVTRELSPKVMAMLIQWFQQQAAKGGQP